MCSVSSGNDEIVLSTSTSQLGPFCPPRNIWQYLGTFLVVTLGKWYWHQWIKISQGATHPTMHKTVPPKRIIWPKMSTVMTLRTCLRLDLPVRKNCTNILKLSLKKQKVIQSVRVCQISLLKREIKWIVQHQESSLTLKLGLANYSPQARCSCCRDFMAHMHPRADWHCELWSPSWDNHCHVFYPPLSALPPQKMGVGSSCPWLTWICTQQLRTQFLATAGHLESQSGNRQLNKLAPLWPATQVEMAGLSKGKKGYTGIILSMTQSI